MFLIFRRLSSSDLLILLAVNSPGEAFSPSMSLSVSFFFFFKLFYQFFCCFILFLLFIF